MRAIWKRELHSYFTTGAGYAFVGGYLLVGGILFVINSLLGGANDVGALFQTLTTITMLLTPILTMRMFDADRRAGADQLLSTAPVSITAIVLGKYLAVMSVLILTLFLSLSYVAIMAALGGVSGALVLAGCLGYLMMGMCYAGVGLFFAACVKTQIAAAIATFAANLLMQFLESVRPALVATAFPWLRAPLSALTLYARSDALFVGVVGVSNIGYFLAFAFVCVFLTVRLLDARRWSEVGAV